jgi:hypothetical protein
MKNSPKKVNIAEQEDLDLLPDNVVKTLKRLKEREVKKIKLKLREYYE